MSKIKFVKEIPEPQRGGGRRGKRIVFVEELKKKPGQWAEYPGAPHPQATAGMLRLAFPGLEAVKRGSQVFARWPKR